MSDLIKSLPETPALLAAFVFGFLSALLLILKIMKEYRALTSEGDALGVHMTLAVLVTLLLSFFLFLFAQSTLQEQSLNLTEELAVVREDEAKLQSNLAVVQQQRIELEKQADILATAVEVVQNDREFLREQVEVLRTPRSSFEINDAQREALREIRDKLNPGVSASERLGDEDINKALTEFRTLQQEIRSMSADM